MISITEKEGENESKKEQIQEKQMILTRNQTSFTTPNEIKDVSVKDHVSQTSSESSFRKNVTEILSRQNSSPSFANKLDPTVRGESLHRTEDVAKESDESKQDSIDELVKKEKEWLDLYPQGREWRDLKDRIIDDREFSFSFKEKLKYAKQFTQFDQMKSNLGISRGQTFTEAKTEFGFELGKGLLYEVVEESIRSIYEDLSKIHEKTLDLLSKIVLNGIMDIDESNRRYLKQTGKIALLRGICSDFTTNKNSFLGDLSEQSSIFEACLVPSLDDLYVMKKDGKLQDKLIRNQDRKKQEIETIYLYNASHPIHKQVIDQQFQRELQYWENVQFTALPFQYDNKYGKINLTKTYSDPTNRDIRGSVIVAGTDLGRILAWKVTFQNLSIDLIASNRPQVGKDKLPITDFKIPMMEPNTIISMNQQHSISIWNLKFIFSEEKLLQQQELQNGRNQLPKRSGLFSCFSMFDSSRKTKSEMIILERIFTINQDDFSFQPYFSSASLTLYPMKPKNAIQKVIASLQGGQHREDEDILIEQQNKKLREKEKSLEPAENVVKTGSGLFSLRNQEILMDRKMATTFCCFRSLGYHEGEPESVIIGTNDGTIIKINLDFLSKQLDSGATATSLEHQKRRQHFLKQSKRNTFFVDKEFVNPNVAPEGFILATHDKATEGKNQNIPSDSNLVFREIFNYHQVSILLIEAICENTEKERIISFDVNGHIAVWKYSPEFFQRACWFTPEKTKKLSFEILEFVENPLPENPFLEVRDEIDIMSMRCIAVNNHPEWKSDANKDGGVNNAERESEGLTAISIEKSFLYYPIYSQEENRWIQYELFEGLFRNRSRRFSTVASNNNSPRKDSLLLKPLRAEPVLSLSSVPDNEINPLPMIIPPPVSAVGVPTSLASKVVQRLRDTMLSNFHQSRALRKHFVQPVVKNLKLLKVQVSTDGMELVLLLRQRNDGEKMKTTKNRATNDDNVEENCYYLSSIILDTLVCQQPYTKIFLLKGEVIKDMAVGSLLLEPLARPVYLLTDRRVLIYSLLSGKEISTSLTTKALITIQRAEMEFKLHEHAALEKISVCLSNRLLVLSLSKPPYLCTYRVRCELSPARIPPWLLWAARGDDEHQSLPWYRSANDLSSAAIRTAEDLLESTTATSISESMIESVHEYAISLVLDGIIRKLEDDQQAFASSVMKIFFDEHLGYIEPTHWPPTMAPDNLKLNKEGLANSEKKKSIEEKEKEAKEFEKGNDPNETIEMGKKHEESNLIKQEKNDELFLDMKIALRETELMTLEDYYQRDLKIRQKEHQLMFFEDLKDV